MRKFRSGILSMLILLLSIPAISQKMTWTTKSDAAKALAMKGAGHFMNAEFEQAYGDFSQAVKLDPDFTVALSYMFNLTRGDMKKAYADKVAKSVGNKTEGEKLFASTVSEKDSTARRNIWAKLHSMFPDDAIIGSVYAQTRPTPDEQFAAAQDYIKKFPDQPSMYNTVAYYYMLNKKDNAMAKQNFEKYISMYPEGSNPYDSMGEFYLNTGDSVNSEKYYRLSLEKYPFTVSSVNAVQKFDDSKQKDAK